MADASAHDEEVEDLVGAKVFVLGIENRKLQRVNDSADGVDDATAQKPQECGEGKGIQQLTEYKYADPAHCNVNDGGEPFGAGNPKCFDSHSYKGDSPYHCKEGIAQVSAQHHQTDGSVGAGNQHENHHMVQLAENTKGFAA